MYRVPARLAITAALALGTAVGVPASARGTVASSTSTDTVRAFSDTKLDVTRAEGLSPAEELSIDIRRVRLWQANRRDAYAEVTMAGKRPSSMGRFTWSTLIEMEPLQGEGDPKIYLYIQRPGKALVDAVWPNGRSENCRSDVEVKNRGRTYRVFLPYRCSWFTASKVRVRSSVYSGTGSLLGRDWRTAAARLYWDDTLQTHG